MPQLLLIKDANTEVKKVGDIIGVFEDSHRFSEHEQEVFHIEKVAGFSTALELKLSLPKPKVERAKLSKTLKWTLDEPEEKEVWQDMDGNWYDFVKSPKKFLNYYSLSAEERRWLSEDVLTKAERIALLQKCENRIKDYPENLTEERDLRGISIG